MGARCRASLRKRPVAMLFQDGNLFPHLDLITNVALGAEPVARPSATARERAREALDRVGLTIHVDRSPAARAASKAARLARLP